MSRKTLAGGLMLALMAVVAWAAEPKKPARPSAEIALTDRSKIVLTLLDDSLPVQTPHGKLMIPIVDIRRIDFAYRLSPDVAKQIDAAIGDLAEHETATRDRACERLLKIGPGAHSAVVRASKSSNRDLAITARQLLVKFQERFPEQRLPNHDMDLIYTEEAKIAGRIEATGLRVLTPHFGEKTLKIADILSIHEGSIEPEPEITSAQPGPANLVNFGGQIGKVYYFKVTGANAGSIYGTDIYTLDSQLAAAAVHAGALKMGQTGIVKVTILAGQNAYQQSSRNGITSYAWGAYHGSYKVAKTGK